MEQVIESKRIAYCGMDCGKCDAYIATMRNDEALREKTAKLWSQMNGVEITGDMIHCAGCRADGVKTPYCESLCPVRPCAVSRHMETCGSCTEMEKCDLVGAMFKNNPEAHRNPVS